MKILLLDNYDSFTYNLVQMLNEILSSDDEVIVKKNDQISINEIADYDRIVLSPGPGLPSESGILLKTIKTYAGKIPMFGVCLGLQAMVEAFGGKLINLDKVHHGVQTELKIIDDSEILKGLKNPVLVGRYHSWVADRNSVPNEFTITSEDENGLVMSVESSEKKLYAVQFHPESIMTPQGKLMLENWIKIN